MGLKSTASQRRHGIWCHREDWVWEGEQLEVALGSMWSMTGSGFLVGVAFLCAPLVRVERISGPGANGPGVVEGVYRVGPPEAAAFQLLQWMRIGPAFTEGAHEVTFEQYLFVQRYVRTTLSSGADRRGWRQTSL
jgi:hypothetical protein